MTVFLPLLDQADEGLLQALTRIAPIVIPSTQCLDQPSTRSYYILADHESTVDPQDVISWLDKGAEKVIVPLLWAKELIGSVPAGRLLLLLDVGNVSAVSDTVRNGVSGVLLKSPTIDLDLIASVSRFFVDSSIHVLSSATAPPSRSTIRELVGVGATLVLPTSMITLSASSESQVNIADIFLAPVQSDRPDGLFPTVVSSSAQGGRTLGLVYSSAESVHESIITGKGVYQSRRHGLWRKGESSGATQEIISIRLDCDSDALEFNVIQHGSGFCHLNQPTCFGELSGLAALENTLQSRLASAPEGSYTRRLFDDQELLRSKIMEEADELCRADTVEDVAFEAADLLYFVMTRCVAAGVSVADIERSLDKKAKKVSRRPGNAKQQWAPKPRQVNLANTIASLQQTNTDSRICMSTSDLTTITPDQRNQLLRRPVLKSDEMISKVKPIVDDVRLRGDAALLELTAKFDKAKLTSTVVLHFPQNPCSLRRLSAKRSIRLTPTFGSSIKHRGNSPPLLSRRCLVSFAPGLLGPSLV